MKSIIKQKHKDFVDELKKTMNKPDPRLNFKAEKTHNDSHVTEDDIQAMLEAKFDELFGPLDDDDDCTCE